MKRKETPNTKLIQIQNENYLIATKRDKRYIQNKQEYKRNQIILIKTVNIFGKDMIRTQALFTSHSRIWKSVRIRKRSHLESYLHCPSTPQIPRVGEGLGCRKG